MALTRLHALIERSAAAALRWQNPLDGSMPPGRNGVYAHRETPVRNTSHWLLTFLAAHRHGGDARFRIAAERAAAYLMQEELRPGGATFWHRSARDRDACNGLVGQAWTLEALAVAGRALGHDGLLKVAESVFLLHPFDEGARLWRRVEIDGRVLSFDFTFNHQLWFAAAGAALAPHASPEVGARVRRFLERLEANLSLHSDGLIRHPLTPRCFAEREPRYAWRFARDTIRRRTALRHKAAGYHAFNLYALALLAERHGEFPVFRQRKFGRLWRYARSDAFRAAVAHNPYAWPYNPVGFEMAYALEVFAGGPRDEQIGWVDEQLRRCFDSSQHLLCRGTPDPETTAARLYEAARLPDLELETTGSR